MTGKFTKTDPQVIFKYVKSCLVSFKIREMKIKLTLKCHIPIDWQKYNFDNTLLVRL